MNYEKLLKIHDPEVSFQILEKFDEYLASLDDAESGFLYPELLSNILNIDLHIIEKLLVYCSQLHICNTRFELTCPIEGVSFYYTFDRKDLSHPSIACTICDLREHDPAECEILVSFKLLEVKNIKKKALLPLPIALTNTFDFNNLKDLESICQVHIHQTNNYYEGQVNQINQGEGSVTNTGTNQGTIANNSKSTVQTGTPPLPDTKKDEEGFLNKIIKFFNDNKVAITSFSLACLFAVLIGLYSMGIISFEEITKWVKSLLKSE